MYCYCIIHIYTNIAYFIISRNLDELPNSNRKRLRPGKLSPQRPVPDNIVRPPYVNTQQAPGIASGPEVHNKEGIERMRASGKLAAQVLEFAGTLVKVWHIQTRLLPFFSIIYQYFFTK